MSNRTHGEAHKTAENRAWKKMRERCLSPTSKDYADYGGRGIKICSEWDDYAAFLRDMGRKPSPAHSIGRKDNDGPYSPENCEWQTPTQQARNRRTSHYLTHNGETLTIAGWAERVGIPVSVLTNRICRREWSTARALTTPCWSTRKEGVRHRLNAVRVSVGGVVLPLAEYAERIGVRYQIAHQRLTRGVLRGAVRVGSGAVATRGAQ